MSKSGIIAGSLAALALLGACSSVTDAEPEEARVVLSGDIPADLTVVTATSFALYRDPETDQLYRIPVEADTMSVRPPFDESYDISELGMFLVKLIASEPDTLRFNVRIAIDGETRYEQDLIMAADAAGSPGTLEWSFGL